MKSNKKALIIACYIGKLPKCINIWLKSCKVNSDFDFLLVTNDKVTDTLPDNVIVLYQELSDIKERFQKCLDFKISLERAYKLCDFKPIYALAFEDYVKDYPFWGHCDIDMVFGRINQFFTDEMFEKYDRLGSLGHLTLYKNNDQMNQLYEKKGTPFSYRKVFASGYSYGFDERFGYNMLCIYNHINWLDCKWQFCLDKNFGYPYSFSNGQNYDEQTVLWKDGRIYQVYKEDGEIKYEEKMYYHFSGTKYFLDDPSEELVFEYSRCVNLEDTIEKHLTNPDFDYAGEEQDKRSSVFYRFFSRSPYRMYIRLKQEFYRSVLRRK